MPSDARCLAVDDTFGPLIAPECRGGFDFTLLFEQIFLSSVPCVFYLLLCTIRLAQLRRREAAMRLDRFCLGKLVSSIGTPPPRMVGADNVFLTDICLQLHSFAVGLSGTVVSSACYPNQGIDPIDSAVACFGLGNCTTILL